MVCHPEFFFIRKFKRYESFANCTQFVIIFDTCANVKSVVNRDLKRVRHCVWRREAYHVKEEDDEGERVSLCHDRGKKEVVGLTRYNNRPAWHGTDSRSETAPRLRTLATTTPSLGGWKGGEMAERTQQRRQWLAAPPSCSTITIAAVASEPLDRETDVRTKT